MTRDMMPLCSRCGHAIVAGDPVERQDGPHLYCPPPHMPFGTTDAFFRWIEKRAHDDADPWGIKQHQRLLWEAFSAGASYASAPAK